jgi:hypothetical protein
MSLLFKVMEAVGKAVGDVGEVDEVDLAAAGLKVYPKKRSTK